jgi:hypothetical protein
VTDFYNHLPGTRHTSVRHVRVHLPITSVTIGRLVMLERSENQKEPTALRQAGGAGLLMWLTALFVIVVRVTTAEVSF